MSEKHTQKNGEELHANQAAHWTEAMGAIRITSETITDHIEPVKRDPKEIEAMNRHDASVAELKAENTQLRAALAATLDWLESFSMPRSASIQEKQDACAVIRAALAKKGD